MMPVFPSEIIIIIIIIIINKIDISPYVICKEIAVRHFRNIITCKTALHEPFANDSRS